MADHTVSDFQISNQHFQFARMRRLAENVNLFGGALSSSTNSGVTPALNLLTRDINGHYEESEAFKFPDNTIARRDPESDAPVVPDRITDEKHIGIKVNSRIGPFRDTYDKFIKRGNTIEAQSMVVGEATGDYQLRDYIFTAVGAGMAAIRGMAGTPLLHVHAGKLNQEALIAAKRRMGDHADQLVTVIGNSGAFFDVMADSYAQNKANVADLLVLEGSNPTLGMPYVRTDNPIFDNAVRDAKGEIVTAATKNYTLVLVPGGITITESEGGVQMHTQKELLKENVFMLLQGEHAYNLDVKGARWDVAGAGQISNANSLAAAASWETYAATKQCCGVLIESDAV